MQQQFQRGFSMIEMLIALLVLSIGLIGVASLQARGQQFNHTAYVRTQAAILAYDIIDRMRANSDNIENNGTADDGTYGLEQGACPESAAACDSMVCSIPDMINYDISQWCQALKSTLPLGDGAIEYKDGVYTITIFWTEDRSEKAKIKKQSWNVVP